MKNETVGKIGIFAIPLAVLGVVGSAAFAATSTPTATPTPTSAPVIQTASATVADTSATQPSEAAEQLTLQSKATITADQAKQIANQKVSGTVTSVQLGDENGTVVYEVAIGTQEVKVNATDGTITKIEAADNGTEAPEAPGTETNDAVAQ